MYSTFKPTSPTIKNTGTKISAKKSKNKRPVKPPGAINFN